MSAESCEKVLFSYMVSLQMSDECVIKNNYLLISQLNPNISFGYSKEQSP